MTTTSTTVQLSPSNSSPLSSLRQLHRAANHAFLLRDYLSTAHSLASASNVLQSFPYPSPDTWLQPLEEGPSTSLPALDRTLELRRKLAILKMTLEATILHSGAPLPPALLAALPELALPPAQLLRTLWLDLLPSSAPLQEAEILPTPEAAFLHPSLPTALAMAALKLDDARSARAIVEAWFGSVDPRVERVVADGLGQREEIPFAFGGEVMDASTASLNGTGKATVLGDGREMLATSWIKLHDLLVLHVLPRLQEWEAAGDFARGQAVENGGFLPDERVTATIQQLDMLRERAVQAHLSAQERDRALAAEATKAARRSVKGKAKDRSSDTSNSPPKKSRPSPTAHPSSSSSSPAASPPLPSAQSVTGFAALRSSLSSFLSSSQSSAPVTIPSSATSSFLDRFIAALKAQDPTRLLTVVCLVFAAVSWMRRTRRGTGRKGVREVVGDVLGKVGETVRMGVKVTSL